MQTNFRIYVMWDLEILYQDKEIVAVNKPSGVLSVPGIKEKYCITEIVKHNFKNCIEHPAVHRLDMDTSGILIVALTKEAQRELSIQFQDRIVKKEYIAILDGKIKEDSGIIQLRTRLDINNRPYQIHDPVNGKLGITKWQKISEKNNKTKIHFFPKTGRTHQLRIHSAHKLGLNTPIVGDRLYGTQKEGERLMLHSSKIKFFHPQTDEEIIIESPPPF